MNSKLKENIGSYIWRKFGTLGLLTGAQMFKPRQFTHLHSGTDPPATNIVGILPGARWGTPEDRLVVVGAHWDTVFNTGGLDDNGSGVAAMLELGRTSLSTLQTSQFDLDLVSVEKALRRPVLFRASIAPWQVQAGVLGGDGGLWSGGDGQPGQSSVHTRFYHSNNHQQHAGLCYRSQTHVEIQSREDDIKSH